MRTRLSPLAGSLALAFTLASCGGGGASTATEAASQDASADAQGMSVTASASDLPAAAPTLLFQQAAALAQGQVMSLPAPPAEVVASGAAADFALAHPLHRLRAIDEDADGQRTGFSSFAGTSTGVSYFSPPQLRAAYGLAAVPAAPTSSLSAAQKAQLGAGQTVYVVVATHDPATLSQLNVAAAQYGLPGCSSTAISYTAALPLAAASTSGCSFSVVGATAGGGFGPISGSVDSSWAVEEQLDVQMAHAMAPLARLVVVVAPTAYGSDLAGAIRLANRMGPGTVNMSFGAPDSSSWGSYDSVLSGSGMVYVAATGDSGYNGGKVEWPSANPNVLAAGGTTLKVVGGLRSESAWSLGGGATSAWRSAPAYQSGYSMTAPARRQVPDVSADADPASAMVIYANAGSGPGWYLVGGTSAAAPLWSGLMATVNAQRKAAGRAVLSLSAPHTALYQSIGRFSVSYTSDLYDVVSGSNGSCATCSAAAGYDLATGLGSPKAAALLPALVNF